MRIRFSCNSCARSYEVPEDAAGKRPKCPACGENLTVPGPQRAPANDESGNKDECREVGDGQGRSEKAALVPRKACGRLGVLRRVPPRDDGEHRVSLRCDRTAGGYSTLGSSVILS
jgi:hypothetical protein